MGTVIAVISGKGGTGKTTVTAAVSSCLAALGKKVLCIGLDAGMRDLEIYLGMPEETEKNFDDVIQGRSSLDSGIVPHPSIEGLYVLAAPTEWPVGGINKQGMATFISYLRPRFDYIFLDSPAGFGEGFQLATAGADRAVVVTTSDPSAIQDARTVSCYLTDQVPLMHLVVNRVQPKIMKKTGTTIDDAMDMTGLPLLGVIPEDDRVALASGKKQALVLSCHRGAVVACLNIANRLQGEYVSLMKIN